MLIFMICVVLFHRQTVFEHLGNLPGVLVTLDHVIDHQFGTLPGVLITLDHIINVDIYGQCGSVSPAVYEHLSI